MSRSAGPSPLPAVLGFTFLNSFGTGVVTNGIFFLSKFGYGFSNSENFALAVLLGVTYIIASFWAHAWIAAVRRVWPGCTSRAILAGLMVLMAALCAVPFLAAEFLPKSVGDQRPASWPIWALIALYTPLTGVLWPMVESYQMGGRHGRELRSSLGVFNVCWSVAIIVAYVAMSPFVSSSPAGTILALGGVHLSAALFLLAFRPEPGEHGEPDAEPGHPQAYPRIDRALLAVFRVLLPAGYLVLSAMNPFLPDSIQRLGLDPAWKSWEAALACGWLAPRALCFLVMGRWHGWHGRWWVPSVGGVLLMVGFAVTIIAPLIAGGLGGLAILLVGLALVGWAMAMIYVGALYYAMTVGRARVDAGGTHEALIGVGYTLGPLCGLIPSLAVERGFIPANAFEPIVLGTVGLIGVAAAVAAVRKAKEGARRTYGSGSQEAAANVAPRVSMPRESSPSGP